MVLKKRPTNKEDTDPIEALADALADKPFDTQKFVNDESVTRTSITLPAYLLRIIEDAAIKNKRNKSNLRSVSAIIRYCLEQHFNK